MKRYIPTTLGALAGATVLAIAVPLSAQAAEGTLVVNGASFEDPSGCLSVSLLPTPLQIENNTDETVIVYVFGSCLGNERSAEVQPGTSQDTMGGSIFIP